MPYSEADHYEEAKRHIATAEEQIAHQKQIIDVLVADGHDAATANQLLETMERSLRIMREHLRQIEEKMAAEGSSAPPVRLDSSL